MKKFQHDKIQNSRIVTTSDRQILAIVECALVSNDFHF